MNNLMKALTTTRGCVVYLIDMRNLCRISIRHMDADQAANRRDQREARKLREAGNPFLVRRAEKLEADVNSRSVTLRRYRKSMVNIGRELMQLAPLIDAAVPQPLLLDLLSVNRADRHRVSPEDGIVAIAFINGLENSAMYRGSSFNEGPLAQAYTAFMHHELVHNEQLKRAADEHLFGKGGMFEFLPTYQLASSGEMVRQPPKLRLADACDAKEG